MKLQQAPDAARQAAGSGLKRTASSTSQRSIGGTVTASDVDHDAVLSFTGSASGTYGAFTVNASTGVWGYSMTNTQSLSANDSFSETFTVTVTDDKGATTSQDVTITITGTNDAPVISSAVQSGSVAEDGPLTAGGTVTVRIVEDPFGQVVVLQVEDTGPGIPEAERKFLAGVEALLPRGARSGLGGLAVGVHSTQFAIREKGLYEPVLRLAAAAREVAQALIATGEVGPAVFDQAASAAASCTDTSPSAKPGMRGTGSGLSSTTACGPRSAGSFTGSRWRW